MFGRKKIQVVKSESYDNSQLFIRVSDVINSSDAMVEVPVTYSAYIIKGGGDMRFYDSGTYNVFDSKEEIKNWKKGLSVEVIYMPKDTPNKIVWGTRDRITYRDFVCGKVITVGANGFTRISIDNHLQFFKKVVGAKREFKVEDFETEFKQDLVGYFRDVFLKVVNEQKIIYDQFDAKILEISNLVGDVLSKKFLKDWGIVLVDFTINTINVSDEDKQKVEQVAEDLRREQEEAKLEAKKKEAMAEIERLADKEWEREKYLRQLEKEDNLAYYEVLKVIGSKENLKSGKGANYCPKCGHSCESTADFCPNCGTRLGRSNIICPDCKTSNSSDAVYCSNCGKKLK